PIQAPRLSLVDVELLSGELTAGDSIRFRLSIENTGGMICPPTTLTLQDQALAWSGSPYLNCPAIGIDETVLTETECLLVLSDQLFPGEQLELVFVSDLADGSDTLQVSLTIEQLNRFAPSLPDAYGYRIYDESDVSYSLAPEYDWLEIYPGLGGSGINLPISDDHDEDDESVQLDLPYPVTYYGQTYESMTICSNGWLALGSSPEVSFYNRVIPSPSGPNAMIAPYWDDLITNPGGVCYRWMEDLLIIEWSRVSHLQVNSTLNFQVIIYNTSSYPTVSGDNMIKMQFKDHQDYDTFANFSTTGIEAPDYSTGLQASFNNIADPSVGALHSGRALLFTTERAVRYAPSEINLDQINLNFVLNPWSLAADSIAIMNSGGSPLVYSIDPLDEADPEPAPDPLAGYDFVKGGPEPDGSVYSTAERDLFDYEWLDQGDAGGPEFHWQDISQPAHEIAYPGDPDDISIGPIELGFDFPFYSELYSQFYFSSNGSMSFESAEHPWSNLPLPNGSAPPALIAPWWDDLNNNDGIQGVPYFWTNGLDSAVICWDNFPKFGTADFHTFQVILVANGDILFQYLEMEGVTSSSTIGIQNSLKNKGLLVGYNTTNNINNGTVIRIRRNLSWLSANAWSGIIEVGETAYFKVNVDTRNLDPGTFSVPLILSSNAGNNSETELTINLEVIQGTLPFGDVNGDYQLNIYDLVALIDFVLQIEIPDADQFIQADLSGEGQLNILDAIILLELLE
ncbi:MAG: dockerin type I repeat-containing protein, partial [Candidatus Marinimicrobia bacterium]|nr:dockerin type I repeat-containing protein [Candidatus Neomarinimicrobiota bacterium]